MNLLYKGQYKARFIPVLKQIKGNNVLELCFGDTIVADYCKKNNINWQGIDINTHFVNNAVSKGFDAQVIDINGITELPKADTIIMTGALYHFIPALDSLFNKVLHSSNRFIISEPIKNISNQNGIFGKLAKGASDVNSQSFDIKFNKQSLLEEIAKQSKRLHFTFQIIEEQNKDLIILITK